MYYDVTVVARIKVDVDIGVSRLTTWRRLYFNEESVREAGVDKRVPTAISRLKTALTSEDFPDKLCCDSGCRLNLKTSHCVITHLSQDKDSEPRDNCMFTRYHGRSAYLKPSGSTSRTFEGNDLALLPLVAALRADRGSGAESNLFWRL